MKKISFLLILSILLTSCAASLGGNFVGSASLGQKNFSYVKNLRGTAQATYILGIGGLSREALAKEAKEEMLAKTPLKDNQAIANVTVDYKNSSFIGIYTTVKCVITADIVEFK
jgi:hypothetical protein